ncbi:conserved hypothetical protein [Leishmania infantum JPCM5]|uniref:Uncharacterized protein n=2 Tax=Leishmania infantum TaxID=5671 RepID=A4I0N0_LEIIN|nr:conserved hypothetical protein [Leishmania infantum JPCM5]CAC9490737.1 hypothetical_protein_-_conserved [Leishmania infantum]CAM68302.1 conserved hypothetical protein [Leishmania infantum JPCM5]SUZ42086.1 hypothetical_protein_-_conserved [Leishmania infantum]|eukprot:XP_001465871.1 conserved hypothetical protein [Leishmania infantum JPCM5]
MRCTRFWVCGALSHVPEATGVVKDYQKIDSQRKELAAREAKKEYESYPLRYQLLECRPGMPLALTKLKYLLACRRTHPDAGGDTESFLRVSLAYQDVMKDYGVETVDNKIVNLGNFQSDDHEAQNYLEARASISSYIPISTLEDHIRQIEEIQRRLGDELSEKLTSNSDEAMWLLEDIEDFMEQTGLKTVKLRVLENGKVRVSDAQVLTDGTERPLFLEDGEAPPERRIPASTTGAETACVNSASKNAFSADAPSNPAKEAPQSSEETLHEAEVSRSDIDILNEKNTLQDRQDVAGVAARTATEVMNNTEEVKQMKLEASVLYVFFVSLMTLVYVYIEGAMRAKRQASSRPETMEHVTSDTMLPWWGNDAEYESQVKRIFVDEWRKARASSRRAQTFQDGVARESLDEETKREMDLKIFTVTAEKLRAMRDNAEKHHVR